MNDDQFDEMFYNATMPDFCQYCHSSIDDPDSDCDGATIDRLEGEVERLRAALRAVMEKSKPSNYRRYTDDGSMGYVVERLHFVPEDVVKQAAQAMEPGTALSGAVGRQLEEQGQ